jgi:hypothetical protein
LLKVATSFFLISICGREQVAVIRGKPIYKITDVAVIPLSSKHDAERAIISANEHASRHSKAQSDENEVTESESEDDDTLSATDSVVDAVDEFVNEAIKPVTAQPGISDRRTSVAQDVIHKKGMYGRFAERWFSKKGWSAESRRVQGLSSEEDLAITDKSRDADSTVPDEPEHAANLPERNTHSGESDVQPEAVSPADIPKAFDGTKDSTTIALLPKILRTAKIYFGTGNFFFSYDYDISHSIDEQQSQSSLPLYQQCDPLVRHVNMNPSLFAVSNRIAVFLEQAYHITIHRRGPTKFRSSRNSRLCRPTIF